MIQDAEAILPKSRGDTIVVLTYDAPHRKTQDVIWRLMSLGYWGQLKIIATPWVKRKQRKYLYGHRPAEKNWPCTPTCQPRELCSKLGLEYTVLEKQELHSVLESLNVDMVVVGGAGILAKNVVCDFRVLNVHPGLLPARRGLDVLKWAIIDCKQVGVTAHICDEQTDLGWFISDTEVPVYLEDTFHSFAMRQYEMELALIDDAVSVLRNNPKGDTHFPKIKPGETKVYKRMPLEIEARLLDAFEVYKKVFV